MHVEQAGGPGRMAVGRARFSFYSRHGLLAPISPRIVATCSAIPHLYACEYRSFITRDINQALPSAVSSRLGSTSNIPPTESKHAILILKLKLDEAHNEQRWSMTGRARSPSAIRCILRRKKAWRKLCSICARLMDLHPGTLLLYLR